MTSALPEVQEAGRADPEVDARMAGALQPLLQAMLVHLRRSRDTPLQFGIDAEGIVGAALNDFLAGLRQGDMDRWQDWRRVTQGLDASVRQALASERPASPQAGHNPARATPSNREEGAPTLPPLVAWLERFYAVLHEVHPRAMEIVALRVEGFQDRDIAERLGMGLRLVRRIVEDMQTNWAQTTRKE
jgi:hypothetical protein